MLRVSPYGLITSTLARRVPIPRGRVLGALGLLAALALTASGAPVAADTASATWALTGDLHDARSFADATLLPNGQVLVAGGNSAITIPTGVAPSLASAELYHPVTGTWSQTGFMTTARVAQTQTLLPDGQVLVTGGFDCDDNGNCPALASAELYNPATGAWTATGSMTTARLYQTATLLPDGKVLVAGGVNNNGPLTSAELYDPATGTFTPTGSMVSANPFVPATLLADGRVLVAGGYANGADVATAELYDPGTGTWKSTGSLGVARDSDTATLLPGGKVLVAGGYTSTTSPPSNTTSAELYDPGTGTWSPTGRLNRGRAGQTATLLPSGQVLCAGGVTNFSPAPTASAELYDPATGQWHLTAPMREGRLLPTATLLRNGTVLVAGGQGTNLKRITLASAEIYTP